MSEIVESAARTVPGGERRRQKAATRRRVKEAAMRCFAEAGYAAANIRDIARAAGVAHGTFYVHFETKAAVLDELLADFNEGLAEALRAAWGTSDGRDLAADVRTAAGVFLDYWNANRDFVEVYAQRATEGLGAESMRDGINPPLAAILGARVAALEAAAGGRAPITDLVTHGLLALWMRIGMRYLFSDRIGRDEALGALVDLTLGAVDRAYGLDLPRAVKETPS